jgi:hypothetical protein
MGGLFSIIPVSSRFLLGFSIGIGGSLYAPNDVFERLRPNLFPIVNQVDIQVDPKNLKKLVKKFNLTQKIKKIFKILKNFIRNQMMKMMRFMISKKAIREEWLIMRIKKKNFIRKKLKEIVMTNYVMSF